MRHLVRILAILVIVLPIVWAVLSSLKPSFQIVGEPWALPKQIVWQNYPNAWKEAGLGRAFLNSFLVTVLTLAVLLPVGSMAAYVLARIPFRGRGIISGAFLGGLMFPHFLVVVPLFMMISKVGLLDTKTGLTLVYVAYSLPFTIFVLTGFFTALPGELEEAATIDGCGPATAFWRVMLPLARPGILVVGIFNAIGLWNEYGLALVLVPGDANRTLPLGIANLSETQQYQGDWGALFAGLVLAMLPVLVVYTLFKDKIHQAMLAGAVKG